MALGEESGNAMVMPVTPMYGGGNGGFGTGFLSRFKRHALRTDQGNRFLIRLRRTRSSGAGRVRFKNRVAYPILKEY